PTLATREGAILGTAPYMSPEQARGRGVDKRTDIWAFGCVLFEMLSGRPVFTGGSTTDVLAAVIHADPDFGALPVGPRDSVRTLLQRCLQKDVHDRQRDIGDARLELQEALKTGSSASSVAAPRRVRHGILAAGAIVAAAATLALGTAIWRASPTEPEMRL